jgi:predicted transcriptional regulator
MLLKDDIRILTCQWGFWSAGGKIRLNMSAKDTRLTFRIRSELKKKLEVVAASESRSVAQICEAFLQAGLVAYEKEGARYISRFLALRDAPPRDRSRERS